MRIAYLECFSGISGDMFLGALLDAGVPPELFTRTVEALGVDARLEISRVDRSGISATKLDVIAAGEKELPREEFWQGAVSSQRSAVSPATALAGAHSPSLEQKRAEQHSHQHDASPQAGAPALHEHGASHGHEHSHGDGESHSHSHEHSHDHSHSPEDSYSHSHESQHEHG